MHRIKDIFGKRGKLFLSAAGVVGFALLIAFGLTNATAGAARSQNQSAVQNPEPTSLSYKFEVDTIKPTRPGDNRSIAGFFGDDTFRARGFSLRAIIEVAYGITPGMHNLLQGGPNWLSSESYEMTAKMDAATADRLKKLKPDERTRIQNQMLQELLAERLKLAIHWEPRELPVYFLTIAKNGLKLKEATPGDTYEKAPYADKFEGGAQAGGMFLVSGTHPGHNTQSIYGFGVSVTTLAWELTFYAQRSVQDRTGLTGNYDFTLEFCRDQLASGSSAVAPDGQAVPSASDPCGAPPFLTAVQQQLGLRMEAGKGPVQVIVIDHVERPSGN
jgi:bla regulator protein blaR1